ncbi:MAG: amidohydrolase family protein [Anaerolineae bacterium]|nr:amidohydrolase family protein [Anaerolineae bacterium]
MKLYLANCLVIDCASDTLQPVAATIAVEHGRIASIDPSAFRPDSEANVIDLAGAYLLPGLWDVHCHPAGMTPDPQRILNFQTEAERTLLAVRNTVAALHVGVTALRAASEANFIDVALRETYANRQPAGLWQKGYGDKRLLGPRLFCAGPAIRVTGGHAANGRVKSLYIEDLFEADGPEEIRKAARQCIKLGVDWIKLFITGGIAGTRESMYEVQMSFEEIKAACDVAHNKGLKVTAHTGCSEAAKIGLRAGLDCIEHGYELDAEVCELMAEHGVYYCPTLSVTQDEAYMRRWEWPEYSIQRALAGAELHRRSFETALKAGVKIVNGADLNPIAETAIPEIEWVVKAGMSPAQALIASTRRPAEMCGVADSLGTVEVGKLADLIAVEQNPLNNISVLREVKLVLKEGTVVVNRLPQKSL